MQVQIYENHAERIRIEEMDFHQLWQRVRQQMVGGQSAELPDFHRRLHLGVLCRCIGSSV